MTVKEKLLTFSLESNRFETKLRRLLLTTIAKNYKNVSPKWMVEYAQDAQSRGLEVIIAGAGGAAHLPGMVASMTPLPVLGVPIKSRALSGVDSLLSIAQMPGGVPVGTLAIGDAGAKNAGLLAVRILSSSDAALRDKMKAFIVTQERNVMEDNVL